MHLRKYIKLIIALDCGIKAHKQISYAKEKNIDFIICDHHNPSDKIPDAYALLNPKRTDCSYPFKELCGCGVGFKLIQAIEQISSDKKEIINYLDLVALAIAADVVSFDWRESNTGIFRPSNYKFKSKTRNTFFIKNQPQKRVCFK